jgi:hypothetical protein
MNERIVAAAIEYRGLTFSVPAPGRHHNVLHLMFEYNIPMEAQRRQGFLTSSGRFVDRIEACKIARAADQIIKKTGPDGELFSEDVW